MKQLLGMGFSLDLRSLALFRIALGIVLLWDLSSKTQYLKDFFTDSGVLPRDVMVQHFPQSFSLYNASGSEYFVILMFLITTFLVVLFILGYKTRLATLLTWILITSLQNRNPLITTSADDVVAFCLLWGMFLPLGAKFSIDSFFESPIYRKRTAVFSVASVAYCLQLFVLYFGAALPKDAPEWRIDGTAIYFALSIGQFVTPFGLWIRSLPTLLLKYLTFSVLIIELTMPVFMVWPKFNGYLRLFAIAVLIGLHTGFGLSLSLGIFSPVVIAYILGFLPPMFWGYFEKRIKKKQQGITIYFDGNCGLCERIVISVKTFFILPDVLIIPAQTNAEIEKDMNKHNSWIITDRQKNRHYNFDGIRSLLRVSPILYWLAPLTNNWLIESIGNRAYEYLSTCRNNNCKLNKINPNPKTYSFWNRLWNIYLPLLLIIYLLLHASESVVNYFQKGTQIIPSLVVSAGSFARLNQNWAVFAPSPPHTTSWKVVTGMKENGETVWITNPEDNNNILVRPGPLSPAYSTHRWIKYTEKFQKSPGLIAAYATYLCKKWNTTYRAEKITSVRIRIVSQQTLLNNKFTTPSVSKDVSFSCEK